MAIIEIANLVKRYGEVPALRGISMQVRKGEILGILGPNGAGKTTALRIITGYLAPNSGSVMIDGDDVRNATKAVRSKIGYLPENTPLYKEMRVREYLTYRAGLKRVPGGQIPERLRYVYEKCRIEDVSGRIIGTLSRGYQQRVGIADALIANPPIIILDEPTVGLDPNQIRQIRELIRELAGHHTVLFSTHILTEVEAVCERVVIINKGEIVAEGSTTDLDVQLRGGTRLLLSLRNPPDHVADDLAKIVGVTDVKHKPAVVQDCFAITVARGHDINEEVFRLAAHQGWRLRELRTEQTSLEDIFAQLTITADAETPEAKVEAS